MYGPKLRNESVGLDFNFTAVIPKVKSGVAHL